jgi:hypothetical protein
LLWLAACGSSGTAAGTATGSGPVVGHDTFSASATAATEEQAYVLARRRLLAALLADESLLATNALGEPLAATVHGQASDPPRFTRVDGGVQAEIGLRRDALRSAFARLDTALANVPAPPVAHALAPAIHALRLASLRRASCLRQRQLVPGASCEPVDTAAERRRLEQSLAGVRLRPVCAGGIPMRKQSWLRPIEVMATLAGEQGEPPLPELALRIQASDRSPPVSARTDTGGIATRPIPKDTPAATTWTVTLDVEELLGPGAKLAHPVSTTLAARPTGFARSALVHAPGKPLAVETARAFWGALQGDIPAPIELAEAEARQLADAGIEKMKDVAPKLAGQMRGALDTILLLDAESEFASRMGTQRVWYEARGTLRVFDAWTGEGVTDVAATVTEAGLGEERAESAARESLGRELAGRLKQKLGGKLSLDPLPRR